MTGIIFIVVGALAFLGYFLWTVGLRGNKYMETKTKPSVVATFFIATICAIIVGAFFYEGFEVITGSTVAITRNLLYWCGGLAVAFNIFTFIWRGEL